MTVRRRSVSMVLGLIVALATLFGVACLCAKTYPPQYPSADAPTSVAYVTHGTPDGQARGLACLSPGHQQCDGAPAVDTPTTGPGPQPQPLVPPALIDSRPAGVPFRSTRYAPPPRPPDLHLLQVLRT
ncbi:hypothetical protein ACIQNG_36380 [Streptomyces sp. NPDC091377]|uniref:hypothetical protein n=1 Tax=Streptomyces sp. NPDC091377 TaxID=3365995 RepID=UPI003810B608